MGFSFSLIITRALIPSRLAKRIKKKGREGNKETKEKQQLNNRKKGKTKILFELLSQMGITCEFTLKRFI